MLKYTHTLLVLIVVSLYSYTIKAQVTQPCEELVPRYDKNKRMWGYTDVFGMMVLEPIYTKVSPFRENKAVVQKGNLSGVISCEGMVLLPLQYEKLTDFRNGKIWAKKNGAWGLLDEKGRIILAHQYTDINPIANAELTWVLKDKKWGLVDESKNKVLCALQYDMIQVMSPNASLVKQGEVFGVLNHVNCAYLLPLTIEHVKRVTQHELLFEEKDKWGIFHFSGKIITNPVYDSIGLYQPNVFIVKQNQKYGLIDFKGIVKLPLVYDAIGEFSAGYCSVKQNGLYGFATRMGKVYIPVSYEAVKPFQKTQAAVNKNGKWGIIDIKNNTVIPFEFDDIMNNTNSTLWLLKKEKGIQLMAIGSTNYKADQSTYDKVYTEDTSSLVRVEKNNSIYYCHANTGVLAFETGYTKAEALIDGFAIVSNNNSYGLINAEGKTIIPFEFEEIVTATKTIQKEWWVKKAGQWGLRNEKKIIWPETYSWVYACSNGLYKVCKDNQYGVVNYLMQTQGELTYDAISYGNIPEWPAVVTKAGKKGLIKNNGQVISTIKYDTISSCGEGYFKARAGKSLFLIKPSGEAVKTKYNDLDTWSEGALAFKTKTTWGYINSTLEETIKPQFDKSGLFVKGLAPAMLQGKVGLINKSGEWVLQPEYDNYTQDLTTRRTVLIKDGKQYLVNEGGKLVFWEE